MFAEPWLGAMLIVGYLGLITFVWSVMLLAVQNWGREWKILEPTEPAPDSGLSVSVCVPARNEALNIGDCVAAVLDNDWPNLELIVVDDRSSDNTGDVAREAANGDTRLKVIDGIEPPSGWAGKPWACMRAAKESKGAWLVFVDADVRLHPKAIRALVETAEANDLALLSLFGTWIVEGFWERVLIPSVGWLIRGAVDLNKVNNVAHPEAFANGQLIAMRRDAYFGIEGHKSVQSEVLEDVRLAEVMKRNGFASQVRPAPWAFRVRLYRSLQEIINGYTKNLYEGLGRRPMAGFGAAVFLFICALLPFCLAIGLSIGTLAFGWQVASIWQIAWLWGIVFLQWGFRYRQERMDGRSGQIAWAQPLANALLIWILLRSTMKVSVEWKGRSFTDGKASS